jgi:hypothetical protein
MRNRRVISLLLSPFLANALTWGMYFVTLGGRDANICSPASSSNVPPP